MYEAKPVNIMGCTTSGKSDTSVLDVVPCRFLHHFITAVLDSGILDLFISSIRRTVHCRAWFESTRYNCGVLNIILIGWIWTRC
ncbi:hypothetical protein AMEX_G24511 [Astyanax mexicanus]|uniref:Uncharacterized protein n=1 Tax=Astyanax mexicanus TaxID=7994 RepID=A0A8T2KT91_ASTMX|nr:hypothetical protein AMEX_G24511 [Astyanax mexicanus]